MGVLDSRVVTKKQALASFLMIILIGAITCFIYVLSVYVGPLNREFGWSKNLLVLAYSLNLFCEIPAYLIGGWAFNKFGIKRFIMFSGILYGLSVLFGGVIHNIYVYLILLGIMAGMGYLFVYIASIALINAMFPTKKGTVIGIMYGAQTAGAVALAPMAAWSIKAFGASLSLVIQGALFTIVLVLATLLITDPSHGDREAFAKAQEEAEAEEQAESLKGKADNELPTLRWKQALKNGGIWYLFFSICLIQIIGNLITSDGVVLAEDVYHVDSMTSAWMASAFGVGGAVGGVVVGVLSDMFGPFITTFWLGIIDGVLLAAMAVAGTNSYMFFLIFCVIQGFTYNGMTAINPIMCTDAFDIKDLGVMMSVVGVGYVVSGVIGPQLGLSAPFIPMLIICAVTSIIGGFFSRLAARSFNKYYQGIGSSCKVR